MLNSPNLSQVPMNESISYQRSHSIADVNCTSRISYTPSNNESNVSKVMSGKKKQFLPVTSIVLGGPEWKKAEYMADLHGEGVVTLKACAFLCTVLEQSKPPTFRGGPLTLSHWALLDPLGKP